EAAMAEANKNADHGAVREWLASGGPAGGGAGVHDEGTKIPGRYPPLSRSEAAVAEANKNADHGAVREWLASDGPAVEAAELHDDVTKLRERYPHLAHFIHPMKLPRGKHRPSRRVSDY